MSAPMRRQISALKRRIAILEEALESREAVDNAVELPVKYGVIFVKDCGVPFTRGLECLKISPAVSLESAKDLAELWAHDPGDCVAVVELVPVSVHTKQGE